MSPLFVLKDSISTSPDAAAFLRTFLPSSSESDAEEDEDEDVSDAEKEGWFCSCGGCGGGRCFLVSFCSVAAVVAAACGF